MDLEARAEAVSQALYAPHGGMAMLPSRAFDQVWERLYLSEESWVLDRAALKAEGITHVLNCAEGTDRRQVNTGAAYYGDDLVGYLGFGGFDTVEFKLQAHFAAANDFISAALRSDPKARVVVHCKVGASRSAAILLAYLVASGAGSLTDVARQVASKREISPNEGFVAQLVEYEAEVLPAAASAAP